MSNASDDAWVEVKLRDHNMGIELKHDEQGKILEMYQELKKCSKVQARLIREYGETIDEVTGKRDPYAPRNPIKRNDSQETKDTKKLQHEATREWLRIIIATLMGKDLEELTFWKTTVKNEDNGGVYLVTFQHVDGPKIQLKKG